MVRTVASICPAKRDTVRADVRQVTMLITGAKPPLRGGGMKLARVIHRDGTPWYLSDDTEINPDIGTVVQVERKTYKFSGTVAYVVHFPGCVGVKELEVSAFNRYFEFL